MNGIYVLGMVGSPGVHELQPGWGECDLAIRRIIAPRGLVSIGAGDPDRDVAGGTAGNKRDEDNGRADFPGRPSLLHRERSLVVGSFHEQIRPYPTDKIG